MVLFVMQVVYCLYLIAGPWYVAQLLTGPAASSIGTAFVFHFGVLVRLPAAAAPGAAAAAEAAAAQPAAWRFVGTGGWWNMLGWRRAAGARGLELRPLRG